MSDSGSKEGVLIADRFRISRHSEKTTFGDRWYARDSETRKQVEVLFVNPSLVEGREDVFALAHAAHTLRHPKIVAVLHQATTPEPVRVTEWERHTTLDRELDDPLLLSTVVPWIADVAEALAVAHAQAIVHGSVSPLSIRILKSRGAQLAHWGLIRLLDGRDDPTASRITNIGGTAWMSPEYALGMRPTPASDIYELGTVLYHCATGSPPFTGPSIKVAAAHVTEVPPPPSLRTAGMPHWLDSLVVSMLSKDPDKRPSAAEVAQQLREGAALLVDHAAQDAQVTANAAPTRLPQVALRGAHSTHVLEVEAPHRGAAPPSDQARWYGLVAIAALLIGMIAGIGFWMRG